VELRPPSRQRPARADRRNCPSEAWGPREETHTPLLDALDWRAGATGAVRMTSKWRRSLYGESVTGLGKGLNSGVGKGLIRLCPGSTARQLLDSWAQQGPDRSRQSQQVPTGVNRKSRHVPTAPYHKGSTATMLRSCQALSSCQAPSRQSDSPSARLQPDSPTTPDIA
jgi:hypothetical protein